MVRLKVWLAILGVVIILAGLAYYYGQKIIPYFFQPTITSVKAGTTLNSTKPETVVEGLTVPWELVFLPNGDLLITERPGQLTQVGKMTKTQTIPRVAQVGEGGLLGMALDPEFSQNRLLYLYRTTRKQGELLNEIVRYRYDSHGVLSDETILLTNIPAARFHNGGRIAFGPDGYLYVTTGDALSKNSAQNKHSLAGKILRLTKDGQPAPKNPFNSPVYSYGHRNPQGLAWDNQGQLWETEHGESAHDEINLIKPGKNYGWPVIQGDETKPNMVTPVLNSGKNETWAPGGAIIMNDDLFFGGLRGQTLYQATLNPNKQTIQTLIGHYRKQFGRIRHVVKGPDGYLYFMTSNRDGRGWPQKKDDRILKVNPEAFKDY
ncbi:PQQ-dependent sugar dehydrogenase [Legionella impletisoli]|uniref:Glucose sorbosone dehydrogenase n=1 Tax=Legionella impletisoli TaxID=343510 RepID=A0A917JYH5_9GAMM|nr:PQQ-dependent sugar dehydrogenase [Legionella impletisoli]GGI90391.1 glucose sorbosone dehydrogenase [Legionella impletisoli]